jgi:hypothetical protein
LDILHHQNGERWAIEVKSSTSVKEYHLVDAAFQYFVMERAGFPPDRVFLMHVNNTYVKKGNIEPSKLFHLEEITDKILLRQQEVQQKHAELLQMLDNASEPVREIGKHCKSPFACDYMHHCWSHLPDNPVFELGNARGKDWQLYEQGVLGLAEVPEDFPLNHRQDLQVKGVKFNEQYIDTAKIQNFMQPLTGPLYFFDFETVNAAIPVLNGTRPFEQIPFQYSLHITDLYGNIIEHKEFLAESGDFLDSGKTDPRLQLIWQLKKDFGAEGNIIAYNATFEKMVLKALSESFPEERLFLESLINRFKDLLIPFKSGWYYRPEMGASASIKYVLPAIAPEFSYDDLQIGNGGLASNTFNAMIENCFDGDIQTTRNHLLAYCERDTEGMVVIYRHLKSLVGNQL